MNNNDRDRLIHKLHLKYGPDDRSHPSFYIPRNLPKKKEKYSAIKGVGRAIVSFFTSEQFGGSDER